MSEELKPVEQVVSETKTSQPQLPLQPSPESYSITNSTTLRSDPANDGSQVMGISLRGLIAIFLVLTICSMSLLKEDIKEPLYSIGVMAVSFYFGHQAGMAKKASQ